MELSARDRDDLEAAVAILENPGLAPRLMEIIGLPLDKAMSVLPANWKRVVGSASQKTLMKVLELALLTMEESKKKPASNLLHKVFVAASGAGGGALGLASLPLELPFSTCLIFRSIADIARSEGEDIRSLPTKLACLEVFALGGRSTEDNAVDTGYFAIRAMLAREVSEAARYLARGRLREGAPAIARLIAAISTRFGAVVSQKVAAQAVPVLGALGGAMVNTVFIDHFQDMARGHFTIRRLERAYGQAEIEAMYRKLAAIGSK